MPVSITNGTNTAVVTTNNALQVDGSGVTQPVSGAVSVSNFPSSQTVSVSNFPSSQTVSVSNFPTTVSVSNTVSTTTGEINTGVVASYSTVSIAANATGTLTYTATTGFTFYLKQIIVGASGPLKVTLSYAASASATTIVFTGFTNASNLNLSQQFIQPIPINAGSVVTMTITNDGTSSFTVYGTILGREE